MGVPESPPPLFNLESNYAPAQLDVNYEQMRTNGASLCCPSLFFPRPQWALCLDAYVWSVGPPPPP